MLLDVSQWQSSGFAGWAYALICKNISVAFLWLFKQTVEQLQRYFQMYSYQKHMLVRKELKAITP